MNEYYVDSVLKSNPYHVPYGENGGQFTSASEVNNANPVAVYQSTLFDSINNELRYDKPDKYKKIIQELDKLSTDETSDTLYRGLGSDFTKTLANKYGIKDLNDIKEVEAKLVGKVIKDKGFISTTRRLETAGEFARETNGKATVMRITGDKKGIEVTNHVDNYRARKEREFIIKRGTSMLIEGAALSKTGKLILYVDVI